MNRMFPAAVMIPLRFSSRTLLAALMAWLLLSSVGSAQSAAARQHPLLIGYFPQWGLYNQPPYLMKNLISAGRTLMVDQLNYAQGFVTERRCSIADPNSDLNYTFSAGQSVDGSADAPTQAFRGNLHQLQELKRLFPQLKILISLEGRGSNFAEDAQPENREAFVRSCVDLFLKGNFAPGVTVPNLFDGIDVDWEYPREGDAANFQALLIELRRQMDGVRPGLTLSIAVGPSPRMYPGTDMAAVNRLVDQVGLMTYNFTGPWSHTTGFIAPLSTVSGYGGQTVEGTVNEYRAAGVTASRLIMGVPFYGYGWRLVPEEAQGLMQEGEPIRGDRPYSYIETLISGSTVYRDPVSQTPWLFDGDAFWTYDDPLSVRRKASYAVEKQLGGLMIWELSEDTQGGALLRAAHEGLHGEAADVRTAGTGPVGAGALGNATPGAIPAALLVPATAGHGGEGRR